MYAARDKRTTTSESATLAMRNDGRTARPDLGMTGKDEGLTVGRAVLAQSQRRRYQDRGFVVVNGNQMVIKEEMQIGPQQQPV